MKPLPEYLNEVRQRADAATKGPWEPNGQSIYRAANKGQIMRIDTHPDRAIDHSFNVNFIAHARQDVETLLEIVRLQGEALKHAYPCGIESQGVQLQIAIAALLKEAK